MSARGADELSFSSLSSSSAIELVRRGIERDSAPKAAAAGDDVADTDKDTDGDGDEAWDAPCTSGDEWCESKLPIPLPFPPPLIGMLSKAAAYDGVPSADGDGAALPLALRDAVVGKCRYADSIRENYFCFGEVQHQNDRETLFCCVDDTTRMFQLDDKYGQICLACPGRRGPTG